MSRFLDLTGLKFGRLTVLERAEDVRYPDPTRKKGSVHVRWLCRCDCGKEKVIAASHLRSGKVVSCGCYQRDITRKQLGVVKKQNAYVVHDNFVIFYTSKNEPFLVDIEDFGKVRKYCWSFNSDGYLITRIKSKTIRLHSYLTGLIGHKGKTLADHQYGNKFDNRRSRLREATRSQNTMNSAMRSDNTSGVTGVTWCKRNNTWEAQICVNGKNHFLGYFADKDEAIAARHAAEDRYFGDFSFRKSRGE